MDKPFTPELPKKRDPNAAAPQLNREQRRLVAKKTSISAIGNNRKNTAGRAIKQEAIGHFITVGDEPRQVSCLRMSRGKGGKIKYVTVAMTLSRGIIAAYADGCRDEHGDIDSAKLGKLPFVGRVVVDDESDSIKKAYLQVLTTSNGRTYNR